MLQIQTTIHHKEHKTVDIRLPAFWKEDTEHNPTFRAAFEDGTFMQVSLLQGSAFIRRQKTDFALPQIAEAHNEWLVTSEEEFMSAYNDARFQTSLEPMLISKQHEVEKDETLTQLLDRVIPRREKTESEY